MSKALRVGIAAAAVLTSIPAWADSAATPNSANKVEQSQKPSKQKGTMGVVQARPRSSNGLCQVGSECDLVTTSWVAG